MNPIVREHLEYLTAGMDLKGKEWLAVALVSHTERFVNRVLEGDVTVSRKEIQQNVKEFLAEKCGHINGKEARQIAADWHGGQRSALYSFCSTGEIHFDFWSYYREINSEIKNLRPTDDQKERLEGLLQYFKDNCPPDEDEEEEDKENEPTLHECNCGFSTDNEYDWDEHECNFTRGRPV